jgi:TonB family protein
MHCIQRRPLARLLNPFPVERSTAEDKPNGKEKAMKAFAMPGLPEYGAVELKAVQHKHLFGGLVLASVLELCIVVSVRIWELRPKPALPKIPFKTISVTNLGPPPTLKETMVIMPRFFQEGGILPDFGTPVPVPEVQAGAGREFATQDQLSTVRGRMDEAENGAGIRIEPDIRMNEPPGDFVAVEIQPRCIQRVNPEYPAVARLAGLEGTVFVKLWLQKDGRIRQVVILKSDSEIFNQAVIDAAMQWQFTPAMMKTGPVEVWISVPFHFSLN